MREILIQERIQGIIALILQLNNSEIHYVKRKKKNMFLKRTRAICLKLKILFLFSNVTQDFIALFQRSDNLSKIEWYFRVQHKVL